MKASYKHITRLEAAKRVYEDWENQTPGRRDTTVDEMLSAALDAAAGWDAEHGGLSASPITDRMMDAGRDALMRDCGKFSRCENRQYQGCDCASDADAVLQAAASVAPTPQPDARVQRLVEAAVIRALGGEVEG